MTRPRLAPGLLALAPACFHPHYDRPLCGPGDACPDGLACIAGVCEDPRGDAGLPDDAGGGSGAIDARVCFGTGLVKLCLTKPPDQVVTFQGTTLLDTSLAASCTQIVAQAGGPDLCVIAGSSITIGGPVLATGTRPLVLIGAGSVTVQGTLDVSSTTGTSPRRTGAGANPTACTVPGLAESDQGGAGGGAGGSFAARGGDGGTGDLNNSGPPNGSAAGGKASAVSGVPRLLRGGCRGGSGGDGDAQHKGGAGGDGGGAVYLIAGSLLRITGDVFASGAGGGTSSDASGAEQGGGGGGTGGMIGLDAPLVDIAGRIVANGGGGGGGGGINTGGMPGGDGTTLNWNTRAAGGAGGTGGTGTVASGAPGTALDLSASVGGSGDGGGGGGGGGVGVVWIDGASTGTMISPAPTPH